jgi:hypothetical protein
MHPTPAPTVTLNPTPAPPTMPKCLVCFRDTGNMVDFFASRLSACEAAIGQMDLCLYKDEKECAEEELVSYKKMVLVFCSDPASELSQLGDTGNIAIKNAHSCASAGAAVFNAYHGVSPPASEGHVLATDCTPVTPAKPGARRLAAKEIYPFSVSDGKAVFTATSVDDDYAFSPTGDLETVMASFTGPNKNFELDLKVELSPFALPTAAGADAIIFPKPANDFWLNSATLWKIGVTPKVAGAILAAKSPTGGKAVGRRLTATSQSETVQGKQEDAKLGDFEKASLALHVLKHAHSGIHHILEKETAEMSWGALIGYSTVAALLVVLALGACRSFLRQKKGYVAPEEQEEETQALGVDQLLAHSE